MPTLYCLVVLRGSRPGEELHWAGAITASAHHCSLEQCLAHGEWKKDESWDLRSSGRQGIIQQKRESTLSDSTGVWLCVIDWMLSQDALWYPFSSWIIWSLKIFVSFRDPWLCKFDNIFLFDFVAYFWGKGFNYTIIFLIQNFPTNIHYRMVCSSIRLEERRKKRKTKKERRHINKTPGYHRLVKSSQICREINYKNHGDCYWLWRLNF